MLDSSAIRRLPGAGAARRLVLATVFIATALSAAPAAAVLVTTNFSGEILLAVDGNPFGLVVGDQVTGFVTVDDDLLGDGFSELVIDSIANAELRLNIGSFSFGTKTDSTGTPIFDDDAEGGYPKAMFDNGLLQAIDFLVRGTLLDGSSAGIAGFDGLVLDAMSSAALAGPQQFDIDFVVYNEETNEDILAGIFHLLVPIGNVLPDNGQVPEPAGLALLGMGLMGFAAVRRRRRA